MYPTVHPDNVPEEMKKLLDWYSSQSISIETLAEFHAKYEYAPISGRKRKKWSAPDLS